MGVVKWYNVRFGSVGRGFDSLHPHMKVCTKCKAEKQDTEFAKRNNVKSGLSYWCKACSAEHARAKYKPEQKQDRDRVRHGLSAEAFASLVEIQEGACKICKESAKLYVDHNHKCCSGTYGCKDCVRGLLCHRCNTGLGLFRDNPDLLVSAIAYLGD